MTAVHKANIMKLADGLFLQISQDISKEYPQIEFEHMIIDNCSMQVKEVFGAYKFNKFLT